MITIAAGPYLRLDLQVERRPIVALLVDHSKSMYLPAGPFSDDSFAGVARAAGLNDSPADASRVRQTLNELPRVQLAHSVVNADGDFLKGLATRFDLRVFSVSQELKPLSMELDSPRIDPPPATGGERSAIGKAIEEVIEQAAGQPIAAIVVLTDGQNNGSSTLSHAAAAAARANAPVYPVPAGSMTPLRDVAIADLFAPSLVSQGDTVNIAVTVESHGLDSRTVQVQLDSADRTLQSRELTLSGAEQQHIELTFQASEPGAHYLKVRISPLDEEIVLENNQDAVLVRVDNQTLDVLVVEGLPRWDFRFLKNGMRRDHGLTPTIIVEPETMLGTIDIAPVPATVDDWNKYRLVILGDCSAEILNEESVASLAAAVRERGMGLIVLAGPNHMPHAYEATALAELLPVRMQPGTAGYDAAPYNPFKLQITAAGAVHEALRIHEEPSRNTALWAQMPPYFWCAATVRPAPGATVLATNPAVQDRFGAIPMITYHFAGKGRVVFIGTDSTWLWRQNAGDRFFYKFWGQAIRFAARRDEEEGNKSWIEVRPIRGQPGDRVEIALAAFTPTGEARYEATQSVTIFNPDGEAQLVSLEGESSSSGRYVGAFVPSAEGEHRIVFQSPEGHELVSASLQVQYSSDELRRVNVDRPSLELLANESGGQLIELTALAGLPGTLRGEVRVANLHREETVWDNWFTAVLLALIYCVDVGVRRLSGLS
jgi:hypothetical protein